ncbi:hypothetical protein D3C86_2041370 [compost metagenome]
MAGGQDAQLVWRAFGVRALAAEGAGAAGQVTGQGVDLRPLVVPCVVMVAPQGCAQAIAQLRTVLEASMGRTAEGLEDLVLFE